MFLDPKGLLFVDGREKNLLYFAPESDEIGRSS